MLLTFYMRNLYEGHITYTQVHTCIVEMFTLLAVIYSVTYSGVTQILDFHAGVNSGVLVTCK